MVLTVVGATTFIFLEEFTSISDGAEVENTNVISTSTQSSSPSGIVYDYPLYANNLPESNMKVPYLTAGYSSLGELELILSEIPRVGETAEITINFTLDMDHPEWEEHKEFITNKMTQGLYISGILEFVDNSEVTSSSPNSGGGTEYVIQKDMPLMSHGDSFTWTAQVRVVEEGFAQIGYYIGGGGAQNQQHINIYVGSEESLLYSDYITIYGKPTPPPSAPVEYVSESERLEMIYKQIHDGTYEGDETEFTNTELIPLDQFPEEEMRQLLIDLGWTDEEIVIELDRIYRPASTQSFSFFPKAYATTPSINVSTKLTVDDLPIGESTNHGIRDVKVCLHEYDSDSRSYTELQCGYTADSGTYYFRNVTPTGSDGTIDFYISYTTDGRYSFVAGDHPTKVLGSAYKRLGSVYDYINSDVYVPMVLDTTRGSADYDNAFWISDAIADSRDRIKDVFGERLPKVNVAWQYDDDVDTFDRSKERGIAYYCPDENSSIIECNKSGTIFLNGYGIAPIVHKDYSYQRWVLLHEYAHHFMVNVVGDDNLPSACYHYYDSFYDKSCMWGEGFADAMPALVDNSFEYEIINSDRFNYEESYYTKVYGLIKYPFLVTENGVDAGQRSELAIAGAIWDMYDNNNHNDKDYRDNVLKDDIQVRMKLFPQVIGDFHPQTFEEFYGNWTGINIRDIMWLHHMDFANTAPVAILHSTVSVAHNTATSITLSGTDTDGDSLNFFITTKPTKGTLSHDSTLVAIPGSGSSVTITYTPRNGQTGNDSFTFKIIDDKFTSSSSIRVNLSIVNTPIITPPSGNSIFSDDFEGNLSQWTLTGDDEIWELRSGIPTGTTGNVASTDNCDSNCYMVSDTINTSQATTLTFDRYVSTRVDNEEGLKVEVSTNNGRTWSEIISFTENNNKNDSTWHTETLDISSYKSNIFKLKFTAINSRSNEIVQIDDVTITGSSGGTVLPPPTTTSSLFEDNFNGLSNWSKSGDDRWRIVSSWSEGMPPNGDSNNKIVAANNCDNSCMLTSNIIDLSSYSSATLELSRFVDRSLDGGEYLSIEVFNGRVWTELAKWGDHNNEDTDDWEFESIDISRYLDDNFKIKITSLQSSSSEDTGLDYIRIVT